MGGNGQPQSDRIGIANAAGQLHRRKMLQADQPIDAEMPLVIEGAEIAEHRSVNPSDRTPRAHPLRHTGGDQIHFVLTRQRQAEIGAQDIRLKQDAGLGARSGDGADVGFFVDTAGLLGILVDHSDAVAMAAKQVRHPGADRAGAENDNERSLMFAIIDNKVLVSDSTSSARKY